MAAAQLTLPGNGIPPSGDVRVSITGTAGRKDDADKVNSALFDWMVEAAKYMIITHWKLDPALVILVSGGAAFADHTAVRLFNQTPRGWGGLHLHLPCKFEDGRHVEDGFKSPGQYANYLHRQFSARCKFDSLAEINQAVVNGALVDSSKDGFHARNTEVAKSEYLIAFTFGIGSVPKDGGTSDTWNKCTSPNKIHLSLTQS